MKPAKVEFFICFKKALLFCDVSFGWYEGTKSPQTYKYDDGSNWFLDSTKEKKVPQNI
jgi:hypothetical protein